MKVSSSKRLTKPAQQGVQADVLPREPTVETGNVFERKDAAKRNVATRQPARDVGQRNKAKETTRRNALSLAGKCTLKLERANPKTDLAREMTELKKTKQGRQLGKPDKDGVKTLAGKDSQNGRRVRLATA